MKKLLLTTALSLVLAAPAMAGTVPYAAERSDAESVATVAPAAGEETTRAE
jgi:hypothetical protein